MRKETESRGNPWYTCVDGGEALCLDHHVTWICNFFVRPEHLQGRPLISGQYCLSSFMIMSRNRRWITSLLYSSTAIAYVKSASAASQPRKSTMKRFGQRCKFHSRS